MVSERLNGTVYIVDDDPLIRSSLETTLASVGLKIEKFATGTHFLACVTPLHLGCLLVDLRMPGVDGLQLQEELVRRNLPISVIIMTGHADVPHVVRAIKNGALDILEKPFKRAQLFSLVASGLTMAHEKFAQIQSTKAIQSKFGTLTNREREITNLLAVGWSNKEIARALDLSPRTVEIHRAHVMEKLAVSNFAALVRVAAEFN